ncbi:MAG TPA: glycosyltransferase family 2 protein [Candidatus Saccharimonadales bacterium]|nr:glycosyltransferase family 2 protein [Candidatus Saccharimonadales bacterium]
MISSKQPLVSIVIVNWNGIDDTIACLENTRKQTYKNIELVVVDNGSADGSVDTLRKINDIVLVENPTNLGFTGGHIAGYNAASGQFILLLNNDAVMDNEYVQKAVDYMIGHDQVGAIGGRAYHWDDDNPLFGTTNKFYAYQNINPTTADGIFTQSDHGYPQEVNNVSGSCVMVRRSVVEQVGYLHNPFFAYFEESDLFARMKRAGFKIIYHPELAIWHANAKSSNRKGSTFAYYMMMRNRFRFAVRNFDSWSLRRFLLFYLKLGLICTVKLPLQDEERYIRRAYAKAFYYNVFRGSAAFYERWKLKKELGPSNYNQLIVREQQPLSVVVACNSKSGLKNCLAYASTMENNDELLLVLSDRKLTNEAGQAVAKNQRLRICKNAGVFDVPSENLGVICAKNELVVSVNQSNVGTVTSLKNDLAEAVYSMFRGGKWLAYFSKSETAVNVKEALSVPCLPLILFRRSLFIEAGGFFKGSAFANNLRSLICYGSLIGKIASINTRVNKAALPSYSDSLRSDIELLGILNARYHEALASRERPDVTQARFKEFAQFRLYQLRLLIKWYASPKITTYLKLARTKNLILSVLTINRQRLAIELTHIRNELVGSRYALNMEKIQQERQARLNYLRDHSEETVIFILTRDRLEPLKQLLAWLNKQSLKKIVLVDNDSTLPPLVDFLNKTNYQVLELGRNAGHRALWTNGIVKTLLPTDFYVVSDPDVVPATNKNVLPHLYELHNLYPNYLKVGLGLKIDDLPDHYRLKSDVIAWEKQFWTKPVQEGVYEAGVDTTFALYKPGTFIYCIHPSLRTGDPYTARHLPWYTNSDQLTDEEIFYRLRADQAVNSWDKDHLPERYKKELARQRS